MRWNLSVPATAVVAVFLLNPNRAWSQASAEPPKPSSFEERIQQAKKPTDWLTWGADLRVRNEYYNNIVTLDQTAPLHEQDVVRFRGRIWASAAPITNLSLNARLSAEPRYWVKDAFTGSLAGDTGMEWRYGIFDILNLKFGGTADFPLSITAGRQDIAFGDYYDWWLVLDGTPGDGSWTFFLDSVRLTYDLKDAKTKVDAIYIAQSARNDDWLPTLRSNEARLTEQNEQGVVLYVSNKSLPKTTIDGYFIYKHDDREYPTMGDNADIYTLGARIAGGIGDHWQYSLEGAYQFGTKQDPMVRSDFVAVPNRDRDIHAYGVKAKLTYLLKDQWNGQISAIGEFLSGDDPDTQGKDEMFDILWGRWPRWSELYIYSYILETGRRIAQLNNIGRVGAAWSENPMKNMTLSLMYNALLAPEKATTRAVTLAPFSQDGHLRGHYVQAILRHQFSKHFNAHLWGEFVWQGSYYTQRELLSFVRAEVLFTF